MTCVYLYMIMLDLFADCYGWQQQFAQRQERVQAGSGSGGAELVRVVGRGRLRAAPPCVVVAGRCSRVYMFQRPSRTFHVSVHPPLNWDWCLHYETVMPALVQTRCECTVRSVQYPRPQDRIECWLNNVSDYISTMNLDINIISSIKFVDAQNHYFGSCLGSSAL